MTTVKEIETAIEKLSRRDFFELSEWVKSRTEDEWTRRLPKTLKRVGSTLWQMKLSLISRPVEPEHSRNRDEESRNTPILVSLQQLTTPHPATCHQAIPVHRTS